MVNQVAPDIDAMVETIVRTVNPERVILFGSWAVGKQDQDSDVDFLVVESEPFSLARSRGEEMTRISRALSGFRVSKDILVVSQDEVEYWRDSLNSVIARAVRQGRVVYERS